MGKVARQDPESPNITVSYMRESLVGDDEKRETTPFEPLKAPK
jgi:hypothetical protein